MRRAAQLGVAGTGSASVLRPFEALLFFLKFLLRNETNEAHPDQSGSHPPFGRCWARRFDFFLRCAGHDGQASQLDLLLQPAAGGAASTPKWIWTLPGGAGAAGGEPFVSDSLGSLGRLATAVGCVCMCFVYSVLLKCT